MRKFHILILLVVAILANSFEFYGQNIVADNVPARYRVIIDNDFSGDPDGLFALAHLLMSPSCEIRAIIGSHVKGLGEVRGGDTADSAVEEIDELLDVMGMKGRYKVCAGARRAMYDSYNAAESDGARAIVEEAMRTDTDKRLFVLCGGSLNTVASAYLMNPAIDGRFTLVWIGGQEYQGQMTVPETMSDVEYNMNISIPAAQTIFNQTSIDIWQIPRNAYRTAMISYAQLQTDVAQSGRVGKYLCEKLTPWLAYGGGETYVLGDNPLVLVTVLQSFFDPDTPSCDFFYTPAPIITNGGKYLQNPSGRKIRVYRTLDNRLMFEDFFAKLRLAARK